MLLVHVVLPLVLIVILKLVLGIMLIVILPLVLTLLILLLLMVVYITSSTNCSINISTDGDTAGMYVCINKMSPYSSSKYVSSTVSTVSNYHLTTVVLTWQVHQLMSKLLLNYCSVKMSNYCTVWWLFIRMHCTCIYINFMVLKSEIHITDVWWCYYNMSFFWLSHNWGKGLQDDDYMYNCMYMSFIMWTV